MLFPLESRFQPTQYLQWIMMLPAEAVFPVEQGFRFRPTLDPAPGLEPRFFITRFQPSPVNSGRT